MLDLNSYNPQKVPVKSLKLAFFQLTFLMIGLSLLVDAVNGFFLSGLGIDPKLSASFKLLLLGLILFQIGTYSRKVLASILTFFMILLIGPIITLIHTASLSGFVNDFTSGLKTYTALIIFVYVALICKKWPERVQKYGKWCLQFSFLVFFINIVLGVLGFGFSSYGSADEEGSATIGVKGFFFAGNEVSGIFIVLSGAVLHLLWQKNKVVYFVVSPIFLAIGLLIATKAAMLAAALLIFAIPLVNERNRLLNLTWLKVKMLLPIVIVVIILLFILVPIFEATGLLNRFIWFYEKKGVIGIILSGRDEFIIAAIDAYMKFANITDIIFGFSKTGLGLITKSSMEIDPIDMYLWFGLAGLVLFLGYIAIFLRVSYLATITANSRWGPCVLLINIAMLAVSMIAGHILTSGMLAPLLGLINGMAYADLTLNQTHNRLNYE